MSVVVVKGGLMDTVQDEGRYGYQSLGINPGGAMDRNAMYLANALVGNDLRAAVLELNFPASTLLFQKSTLIALSGADFNAHLNGQNVPLYQPIVVKEASELKFSKRRHGAYCYLAVFGGWEVPLWLGSRSTNLIAQMGGVEGRRLMKGDTLKHPDLPFSTEEVKVLPWRVNNSEFYRTDGKIHCIMGNEFGWLAKRSQLDFIKGNYAITANSNRMGYRLKGKLLRKKLKAELLSTAVTFGTIQVLPNGELIVLMADHQTTGGYPRVAHAISAERSTLAQLTTGDAIKFEFLDVTTAEALLYNQQTSIRQIKASCQFKIREYAALH